MDWLKPYRNRILTALAISLFVGCAGAFLMWVVVGDQYGSSHYTPYYTIKPQIQNAVTSYIWDHNGERPPYEGIYNITINDHEYKECDVIDMCSIIGVGEYLRSVPEGCYGERGEYGTNFYTGECDNPIDGDYVWLMNEEGQVYSTCIGDLCDDNNEDGYQRVWLGDHEGSPPTWWSEHWEGVAALLGIIILTFLIMLFLCIVHIMRRQTP